jgi:hypothetical protein
VPEWGPLGSVRGALSNERPYRDLRNVVANYPFERSHRFPVIEPNSGRRDYSRFELRRGDTQLGPSARISAGVPPGSPYDALASPARSARSA